MNGYELCEKILPYLELKIENLKEITIVKDDPQENEPLKCNKNKVGVLGMHLLPYSDTDGEKLTLSNSFNKRRNPILLKLFESACRCTFYIFKKQIQTVLSKRISLLIKNRLLLSDNADAYECYDKWEKIEKILNTNCQPYDNFIIRFKDDECRVKVSENEQLLEISKHFCVKVSSPIYELLKESTQSTILGISLSESEKNLLQDTFRFIFEDLDNAANYTYPRNLPLYDMKSHKKTHLVHGKQVSNPLVLIKAFISIAKLTDDAMEKLSLIDNTNAKLQPFDIPITEEMIDSIDETKERLNYQDSEQTTDFIEEIKLHSTSGEKNTLPMDIDTLNYKLNEESKDVVAALKNSNINKSSMAQNFFLGSAMTMPTLCDDEVAIPEKKSDKHKEIVPIEARESHTYIVAGSDGGKSELIKRLFISDVKRSNESIVLFDPHGDLALECAKLVEDESRLIYIDPFLYDDKAPVINPFEVTDKNEKNISTRTQALVSAFEVAIGIEWSTNMEAVITPCISVLLRKDDTSIVDLQRFMDDEENSDLVKDGIHSPLETQRNFFEKEFTKKKYSVTKEAISTKLQTFLNDQKLADFTKGKSVIDLEKELNTKGRVVIFRLVKSNIDRSFNLYSRLLIALIQAIVYKRESTAKEDRVKTHLYIDEFQYFISPSIENILSGARKFGLYMTVAHQSVVQLDKKLKEIIFSNTGLKFIGLNSHSELTQLAKEIEVNLDGIKGLTSGEFYFKQRGSVAGFLNKSSTIVDKNNELSQEDWQERLRKQASKYYREEVKKSIITAKPSTISKEFKELVDKEINFETLDLSKMPKDF